MFIAHKIWPPINSIPKMAPKFILRPPSYVAQGTLLLATTEYNDIQKFLYFHNQYLFKLKTSQDVDFQTFKLYAEIMLKNPKIFQHILSVAYPKASYSLYELRAFFSKINIDGGQANLFVKEDVVVAATAANVMKENIIFKKGSLTVLACDYDETKNKKEIKNLVALAQTKQEHPDYCYVYKSMDSNNNNGLWQRYYDFKTGKFNIDTGHIYCVSNLHDYEEKVKHHLHGQYSFYREVEIQKKYKEILNDTSLTWAQRNFQIQEFWRDNLHKYPHTNPSFILYHPALYEIDNATVPKSFTGFINSTSLESVENTQLMLAKAISLGGKTCQENYQKHPYNSPIIVGMIRDFVNEHLP